MSDEVEEVHRVLADRWKQDGPADPAELARREQIMRDRWDWDEWNHAVPVEEAVELLRERLERDKDTP